MSFYFRKGINFGPVRINFSKSGVGASIGVKGIRIGLNSKGPYLHMGTNGVYYRKNLNKKD